MKMDKLAAMFVFSFALIPVFSMALPPTNPPQNSALISISAIRQDPFPAVPGDKVSVLLKIENLGQYNAEDVKLTIVPKYPFMLYGGGKNETTSIGTIRGVQYGKDAFQVTYDLLVDKDAADEQGEIEAVSSYDGASGYGTRTINISVQNPRTNFDIIGEQASEFIAYIVLANSGKNDAQSVALIVRDGYAQKIYDAGNLKSGNYTRIKISIPPGARTANSVDVEIRYTDKLGYRRTVPKAAPVFFNDKKDFEIFSQETTANAVTLAVMNVGNSPLYAVVVSMPDQENTKVSGASQYVIGNLDVGDYSLASFSLASSAANRTRGAGFWQPNASGASVQGAQGMLKMEISYTDEIGERHTTIRNLPFNFAVSAISSVVGQTAAAGGQFGRNAGFQMNYVVIGAVGIVVVIGAFWLLGRRGKKGTNK